MKMLIKLFASVFTLLLVMVAGVIFSGKTMDVLAYLGKPKHGFDLSKKAAEPDYAVEKNWVALPGIDDPSDLMPEGTQALYAEGEAPVDVFFVHPTGYLHGGDWNFPLTENSVTDENTAWMLANQASPFNACCNIYAPRYRQASYYAYAVKDDVILDQSLSFAYNDVLRAFNYYLEHYNQGRPFILQAHSQGTHHALRLLKETISGTPLRDQMVAAYITGGGITHKELSLINDIDVCQHPVDLHCVLHWASYGEGGEVNTDYMSSDTICTNPVSWKLDSQRVPASEHAGAVVYTGDYQILPHKEDIATGMVLTAMPKPLPDYTWAQCIDGALWVAPQEEGPLAKGANMPGKDYHTLDYALFYMNIRENAVIRTREYLKARKTMH